MTGEPEATRFWEQRYGERDRIWSGRVNQVLADVAADLTPGHALDLGAGEGGDALWLAARGWQVTAVDVSATALSRARSAAADAGVAEQINFRQCDLATDFPAGSYDLVSAQYLHSPVEFPRAVVLRRAADAVGAGGRLLIVDHAAPPPWSQAHQHQDQDGHWHDGPPLPTLEEAFASLELVPDRWRVERCETVEREATGPDGRTGTLLDNVILASQLA